MSDDTTGGRPADASTSRYWADLTTVECAERCAGDPVVILPVAAIEQHGPHLPLSTDAVIGDAILRLALDRLAPELAVLVLPTQSLGTSEEHAYFAGTLTLAPETLIDTLFEVGASLARAGVRRLIIGNSHGGNRGVIDVVGLRLRQEFDMLVVKAQYTRFERPAGVGLPEVEWEHGLHGGAVETAMMMHLRPELVRGGAVDHFASLGQELDGLLTRVAPEGQAPFSWTAADLNPAGVVGDATLATTAMGARLVDHYANCLADVIRDTIAFPLDRLAALGFVLD